MVTRLRAHECGKDGLRLISTLIACLIPMMLMVSCFVRSLGANILMGDRLMGDRLMGDRLMGDRLMGDRYGDWRMRHDRRLHELLHKRVY